MEAAFDGSSPVCRTTMDAFSAFLGAVAGDVALTFGARGGVYIGGGIAPRFVDHLARSAFREQFLSKGRMRSHLERIPTRIILHPNPAFVGLMSLARHGGNAAASRAGVQVG
jgi:glucokinase